MAKVRQATLTRTLVTWLTLATVLTTALALLCVIMPHPRGWALMAVGAGVSLFSCLAAEVVEIVLQNTGNARHPVSLVVAPMMVRSGLPLAAVLFVYFGASHLLDWGFLVYCLPFQVVTLVVECRAALQRVESTQRVLDP